MGEFFNASESLKLSVFRQEINIPCQGTDTSALSRHAELFGEICVYVSYCVHGNLLMGLYQQNEDNVSNGALLYVII